MLMQSLDLVCQDVSILHTPHQNSCISPKRRSVTGYVGRLYEEAQSFPCRQMCTSIRDQRIEVYAPGKQAIRVDGSSGSASG